jgi:hypothetical protein
LLSTGSCGKVNVVNPLSLLVVVISNPEVYNLGKLIALGPLSLTLDTLTVEPEAYVIVLESAASSQRTAEGNAEGKNTGVNGGNNLNAFVDGRTV